MKSTGCGPCSRTSSGFSTITCCSWVPTYCERIATEAREPFFAAVARMTAEAIALDRENIDDLLREAAIQLSFALGDTTMPSSVSRMP